MIRPIATCLAAAACLMLVVPFGASAQSPTDRERMMRPLTDPNAKAPSIPEVVVTRGWGNEKFGRIVFDWRTPVKFSAKIVGTQLRIRFDRPLKTEFAKAAKSLEPYLSELQVGASGTTISANLKGYYSLRSFSNENAVVIDLTPEESSKASKEVDPDAWLKRTPKIPVRAGKHPKFGRLVFDWSDEVGYDIERDGDVVRIRFDRPARVDVSRLSSTLPGRVSAASAETTKSAVRIGLIIPGTAKIRHFRDGTKIALDIVAPAGHEDTAHASDEHHVAETPEQKKARMSKKAFSGKAADAAPKASSKKARSLTKKKAKRLKRLADRERRRNAKKFKGAPLVTVETTRRGAALDIKFNWRKDVAAAVFRRGEEYWILFDGRARLALGSLRVAGEGMVEEIEQTDAAEKSLLRLKVPEHLLATATKSGTSWKVSLAPARMTGPPVTPIEIRADIDGNQQPAVLIAAKGLGRPHVFADRSVGDIVHVYPVLRPGLGNRVARNLVDVAIPASAAGLVLVPRRDDIALIRNAEGVYIAAPGGLSVSRSLEVVAQSVSSDAGYAFGALSDWGGGPAKEFRDEKYVKLRRILVAPEDKRNDARFAYARFLISRGMAADALGVLEVALKQDPKLAADVGYIALRAAAHYLLGHYAAAEPDFEHVHLINDPSVAPWRAGIAAAKGDWLAAYKLIRDSRGNVAAFPKWLKTRFQMIGAEAALAVKDTDGAKLWLDALRGSSLKEKDAQYVKFLSGHALRLQGKPSAAKSLWREVLQSGDRRVRTKAGFALVNADLATNQTDRKKAIETLEGLAFAWRGDAFEFDLKRRLGDIHAEEGEYRASLLRLRQAASHFKDVEGASAIAEDMRKRFRSLFLDGNADKLPPVKALALYEEFRELTPAGSDGDEMIRKLADRLAKVDLLSEAGRLLEHQVRFRLTGLERSRVGSRLALLRMFDREPAKAIEALKLSDGEELPRELEFQRRYLKVRAYGDNNESAKGLELLAGDVSHEAELLRLGLHWKNAQWEDVARTVRRIIPQQTVDVLDPKHADLVLRWGIALTMENDTDGLTLLRDRFGPAMEKTKYKEALKAIAGVEIGLVQDFKELVRQTGDLGDYQSFLASYRDKVQSNALSAIN
jgi:tetratricopeptide (TPR) repeat protein